MNRKSNRLLSTLEGYEFATLSLKDSLPDLSKEINNADAYISKPSAEIQLADTSYKVDQLKISNQLPDLADVLKNPEKYTEPKPESVVVDEESLLKNIANVQFKPFYDGSETFEVLNDFDDSNAPSVSDIQKEFSQFDNFEISNQDDDVAPEVQNDYDDFEALYRNDFVDLDIQKPKPEVVKTPDEPEQEILAEAKEEENDSDSILEEIAIEEPSVPKEEIPQRETVKPIKEIAKPKPAAAESIRTRRVERKPAVEPVSESLAQKLAKDREERMARRARIMLSKQKTTSVSDEKTSPKEIKCVLDNEMFTIISSVNFSDNIGCHLAKNDKGYTVLGFSGSKLSKLKEYPELKSERIQARISEKLPDGSVRYIVRIGVRKFIVSLNNDNIEYVMDLC